MPSTPYDAKGLLKTAIRDDSPVVFLEHKLLYGAKLRVSKNKPAAEPSQHITELFKPAPEQEYTIEFGVADVKRLGRDVTVVATSLMVHKAVKAAEQLKEEGIDAEVIDPRTLVPLDEETILQSVRKTSRLVVVSEGQLSCGMTSEISAMVAEKAFPHLKAPIKRVAVPNTPIPFAPVMEERVVPDEEQIIDAIRSILE
jgi:pyruvate dehydrogenase E1 component beta subunit